MDKKNRKHFTPEEKVAILKRHLVEHVPVSNLCDEYKLHVTVFYRWQKEFFENGAAAFVRQNGREKSAQEERITALEDKLKRKNDVMAELMEAMPVPA